MSLQIFWEIKARVDTFYGPLYSLPNIYHKIIQLYSSLIYNIWTYLFFTLLRTLDAPPPPKSFPDHKVVGVLLMISTVYHSPSMTQVHVLVYIPVYNTHTNTPLDEDQTTSQTQHRGHISAGFSLMGFFTLWLSTPRLLTAGTTTVKIGDDFHL